MRKRLLALLAITAFVVAPTFASLSDTVDSAKKSVSIKTEETKEKLFDNTTHPTWAAGLSLGTNSGVQVDYRYSDMMTIKGVLGFGILDKNLMLEGYAMYNVADFEISEQKFKINAGPGINLGVTFADPATVSTAVLGAGEVTYSFDDDLPLDLALRVGVGYKFVLTEFSASDITVPAAITCTYRFI
ncbi:MAG: hypothetical protein ACRQFF_09265 [Sphaerochaeta sp.]